MKASVAAPIAIVLLLASCSGADNPSRGRSPRVGSSAPDFELPEVGGGTVSLASFRGERAALLYFSMGPG